MSTIKGLTVVIDGNVTPLSKKMAELKAEATTLGAHFRSMSNLLAINPTNTALWARQQGIINAGLASTQIALTKLREAEAQLAAFQGPMTAKQIRQWQGLQRRITETEIALARWKQQAIEAGAAASARTLAAAGALDKYGAKLRAIGTYTALISAGILFLGVAAVKSASDFDSSFTGVMKTITATEYEYQQLARAARDMALVKPVDVNDINHIMELGGQLNIAREHLEGFASVIADLQVSTDLELESAAMQLAQFSNIVNMSQGDFDRLGAVIADLGNNSATTESQIMLMAMRVAGAGANIGLSTQNILALSTALASTGIRAEMGGNAISTIMNRIDRDVALNTDTLAVWAETAGMSVEDFAYQWKNNVMDTLMAVIKGMGDFRASGNNLNVLLSEMHISYMRQVDVMQRLSRTYNLVAYDVALADKAWDENYALVREATLRYETAESRIQSMKNAFNELALTIGNEILPNFKDTVIGITDGIKAFAAMSDGFKDTAISAGATVAALGLVVPVVGGVAGAVAKLLKGLASAKTMLALWTAGELAATEMTIASTAVINGETAALEGNMAAAVANARGKSVLTVAYEACSKAAATFNAILAGEAALNPVIAAAVIAVAAAFAIYKFNASQAAEVNERWTSATEKQAQSLENAKKRLEDSVRVAGEFSESADKARAALADEEMEFDNMKETLGEFNDRIQETIDAHDALVESMHENMETASSNAGVIRNLADELEHLVAANDGGVNNAEIATTIELLGSYLPDLSYTFSDIEENGMGAAEAISRFVDEAADSKKASAALENMSSLESDAYEIKNSIEDVTAELEALDPEGWFSGGATWTNGILATNGKTRAEAEYIIGLWDRYGDLREREADNQSQYEYYKQQAQDFVTRTVAMDYALNQLANGEAKSADEAQRMAENLFGIDFEDGAVESEKMTQAADEQAKAEANAAAELAELVTQIENYEMESPAFATALTNAGYGAEEFARKLTDLNISFDDVKNGIADLAAANQNGWEQIEREESIGIQAYIDNLLANQQTTREWAATMNELYSRSGSDITHAWLRSIEELGPEYYNFVGELGQLTGAELDNIAALWAQGGEEAMMEYFVSMGFAEEQARTLAAAAAQATEEGMGEGDFAGAAKDNANEYTEELGAHDGEARTQGGVLGAAGAGGARNTDWMWRNAGAYLASQLASGVSSSSALASAVAGVQATVSSALASLNGAASSLPSPGTLFGGGGVSPASLSAGPNMSTNGYTGSGGMSLLGSNRAVVQNSYYNINGMDYTSNARIEGAVFNLFDTMQREGVM